MAEYIEREATLNDICLEEERAKQFRFPMGSDKASFRSGMLTAFGLASSIIGRQKAADVEPVRHGKWSDPECDDGGNEWHCICCGYAVKVFLGPPAYKYCPNCGSKMDKDNEA